MAHPDFEAMLDHARAMAEKFLRANGEFLPFGVDVIDDGSVESVAGDVGTEYPQSSAVISFLKGYFRSAAKAGGIRASAVCYMGMASHPSFSVPKDALIIDMDHVDTDAIRLAIPYELHGGAVSFGEILVSRTKGYLSDQQP